jgi:hypothetical protein
MDTIKFKHEEDLYCTHQPVLMEALKLSTGNVLELGCGFGSTELIHRYCKKHNRNVYTLESDLNWMVKLNQYKDKNHEFTYVNDWKSAIEKVANIEWGLVFIDQGPCSVMGSWLARTLSFKTFREKADYLVLHDCDYFPENDLLGKCIRAKDPQKSLYDTGERCWDNEIKYWKEYQPRKMLCWTGTIFTGPPTLLASNKHKIDTEVDFSIMEASF